MDLDSEKELPFQLGTRYNVELMQLVTNFAAGSLGRGMASIDKGLRPAALREIPDVGVHAAHSTPQVHLADQEGKLPFNIISLRFLVTQSDGNP